MQTHFGGLRLWAQINNRAARPCTSTAHRRCESVPRLCLPIAPAPPALPAHGQRTLAPLAPCPRGTESRGAPSPDNEKRCWRTRRSFSPREETRQCQKRAGSRGPGSGAPKLQAAAPLWSNSYRCYVNNAEELFTAHHEAVRIGFAWKISL